MTFRVLGKRVVVRPEERRNLTAKQIELGLVSPDSYIPEPEVSGVVRQIGPGVTTVTVGQRVFFSPQAGFEATVGELRVLVIPEEQILAVVEE